MRRNSLKTKLEKTLPLNYSLKHFKMSNKQTKKAPWSSLTLGLLGSKVNIFMVVHTIWSKILNCTDDFKAHIMTYSVSPQHTYSAQLT